MQSADIEKTPISPSEQVPHNPMQQLHLQYEPQKAYPLQASQNMSTVPQQPKAYVQRSMPQSGSSQYLCNNQQMYHPAQQESNSNSTHSLQYNQQKAYPMQLAQTMNPMGQQITYSQQTVSSLLTMKRKVMDMT